MKRDILKKLIDVQWIRAIDIDRKGYVILSDITRFMNFNSDSFYRNRDLALVFKRLLSNDRKKGN